MSEKLNENLFKRPSRYGVSLIIECKNKTSGKTEFKEYLNRSCFGFLGNTHLLVEQNEPINLYYIIPESSTFQKEVDEWHKWIFNPKLSPWRSLIPEEGLEYSLTKWKSYVKIPISEKTPAQLLVSFLIATRCDETEQANMFSKLRNKGWDDYLALYTSIYFGLDKSGKVSDLFQRSYYTFNSRIGNSFEKLKEGGPTLDVNNTFGKNYGPIQKIWAEDNKITFQHERPKLYHILTSPRKYDGALSKLFISMYPSGFMPLDKMPSFDELLKKKDEIIEKVINNGK